jgi:uncharacterized protein YlxW (UPF0749 family)
LEAGVKVGHFQRYFSGLGIAAMFGGVAQTAGTPATTISTVAPRDTHRGLPPGFRELVHPTRVRGTIAAILIGALTGIFLIAEWQTTIEVPATASRPSVTRETIDRLESEQAQLKQQITDLRSKNAADQQAASNSQQVETVFNSEIADQRAIAGTVPLEGNGIDLLLDDSASHALLPSDPVDNYIVHEYQIRDAANLLWEAGAVGISVNGERFVNSTSVYCVGSTILINDTRTSPPYHILAVGDPAKFRAALDDGNALRDIKSRVDSYGLIFQVAGSGPVSLPAFDGGIAMKHTVSSP